MPCLVKCYLDGIRTDMSVTVRTDSGKYLPRRDPPGFSPPDGDRVFLRTIEQGHGGDGLAQRGRLQGFRQEGKTFKFQVWNAEQRTQELRGRDLCSRAAQSATEASVKENICEYRPPTIVELTEGEAAYLDQYYRSALTHIGSGELPIDNGDGNLDYLVDDLDAVRNDRSVDETTRARLIQARLGQGQFRDDLLGRWRGACAVTECTQLEVLRASHVRPWRESSHEARLNPANGILLTANLDALFDRFLISFEDDGRMLMSDRVAERCRELLGLPAPLRSELTSEEKSFLDFHRDRFRQGS